MKGLLHSIRTIGDIILSLFSDIQGNGAVGLSLCNTSEIPLIIGDGANEEIAFDQYFFIENETAIISTAFCIIFRKEADKCLEAITHYIVP